MRWTLLLLCLAGQACTFDSSLPDAIVIRCGPAGECPSGYRCNADFDQCRRESPDELPLLTASFSPSRLVRTGSVLEISVRADRALQAAPRVRAQHRDGSVVLTGGSSTEGFRDTTFELTVTPELGEGQVVLFADAIASTGVLVTSARIGDFIVDDTPPRLLEGSTVTPSPAQRDARVSVRVEFDEPVRDSVRLVVQRGATAEVVTPSSNRIGGATFQVTVPPDAVDGVASLSLTGVTDEAGNDAVGPLDLPPLLIDSTPPGAQPLSLDGRRFSRVPGYDVIRFDVVFDEVVSDARWCLGNRCEVVPPATTEITISLADAGFPEGPAPLVVTGRDLAGNVGSRTEFVTLDFSAPSLASDPTSVITPRPDCPLRAVSALGVGGTHRLSFTVNEPLSAPPVVSLGAWTWQAAGSFDGGTSYQFSNTPPGPGLALDGELRARVVDAVGNEGLLTLVADLRVDLEAPQPLADADQSLLTYERIPWGAARSAGLPRFSVEGRPGPWLADDVLVFFEGPTAQSFVLGESRPVPGGVVPRVEFSRTDRQRIWVLRHDTACNPATPDPQPLKNSTWVASAMSSPSSPRNPNVVSLAEVASTAPLATRRAPVTPVAAVSSTAHGAWKVGLAGPIPAAMTPRLGDALLVGDPLRGRTIMLGGAFGTREVWTSDGSSWSLLPVPPSMPAPSYTEGLFEAHTGRIVFLAGSPTVETWYLDGDRFGEISTPPLVATNSNPVWAYDPLRRRIVMFGGTRNGTTGYHNETWVLDASGWQRLVTGGASPPATNSRRLIYDAAGQRMLLLAHENLVRVAYVLEGDVWRQIAAPTTNLAFGLSGAAVAFDQSLNSVIVFGGGQCCSGTSATTRLVNDTWQTMPVPTALVGRNGPKLGWDPERNRLVMCGGYGGSTIGTLTDCWVYENQTWRPIEGPADPQVLPTSSSMRFDPARRRMMLVGGNQSATWVLEGDAWVRTSSPAGFTPRSGASLVNDPTHGRLLYVGGLVPVDGGPSIPVPEVWSMSTATTRLPDGPFGPRHQHSMVADPANSRVVLIGGRDTSSTTVLAPMDTWLFDGQRWTSLPATSGMNGRALATAAADPATGRLALVGALLPFTAASEVWLFNAGVWAPHPNLPVPWSPHRRATVGFDPTRQSFVSFVGFASAPLADGGVQSRSEAWSFDQNVFRPVAPQSIRSNSAVAFDPTTGRLLTFGGNLADAGVGAETWQLEGDQWTLLQPPVSPAPRTSAVLCAHPASRQFVLLGGGPSSTTFAEDSWVFGFDGWNRVELPESFGPRSGVTCTYDEARGVLVALSSTANDTFEFSLDPRVGPGLMLSVDLTSLLPAGASVTVLSATSRAAGDSALVIDPLAGRGFVLPDGGAEALDGGTLSLSDGGTFRRFAVPRPGAALQVWDSARSGFVTLASTDQRPDAGLALLRFAVDAGSLLNGTGLFLQVTSLAGSDVSQPGGVRATVVAEPPEVEVLYTVP